MESARQISGSVEGQLLIAVPHMEDPRFRHSVIFMCSHTRSGAVGLVVNKLIDDMPFTDLLQQLDIERGEHANAIRVHFGGPVEPGRGFVLHTQDYRIDGTAQVAGGMALTATTDILRDMASGRGPQDCLLALGYSGWGPGQLDREIQENGWLVAPADRELLFDAEVETKWKRAYAKLGVEPGALSQTSGRA
ncbi:MAG: YqgE/AlgH family protein [Reyranellaceae bacterium]